MIDIQDYAASSYSVEHRYYATGDLEIDMFIIYDDSPECTFVLVEDANGTGNRVIGCQELSVHPLYDLTVSDDQFHDTLARIVLDLLSSTQTPAFNSYARGVS